MARAQPEDGVALRQVEHIERGVEEHHRMREHPLDQVECLTDRMLPHVVENNVAVIDRVLKQDGHPVKTARFRVEVELLVRIAARIDDHCLPL